MKWAGQPIFQNNGRISSDQSEHVSRKILQLTFSSVLYTRMVTLPSSFRSLCLEGIVIRIHTLETCPSRLLGDFEEMIRKPDTCGFRLVIFSEHDALLESWTMASASTASTPSKLHSVAT